MCTVDIRKQKMDYPFNKILTTNIKEKESVSSTGRLVAVTFTFF